ncbi:hypothetical protein [uncultured Amphritea sp.]|mgnify:CR=1 FL=1|uniref:hypothetical protein n=1 Tax=uncultured Amphritea sp. TaxID=981605 RepID=UPI0026179E29|nr:hypothetical protein [uncultured Amphritea sp.]
MIIGIDPDLVKSGVAVTVDGTIITLDAMPFFDLCRFIDEHKHQCVFHVEDVECNKSVFIRPGTSPAAMRKIAQNVGQVKAIVRLLVEYLNGAGANYKMVRPLVGHVKKAKGDAEFFNRLTGWTGKSNEDKRDAALLALYG